jgi:hypothetical protein
MKNIILYAYYKGDTDGEVALEFFLKYGVKDDPNYDYYFINSGELTTQVLPSFFKVIQRANLGYDFGAWSDAILNIDISKYDYFIFLNNSSIGPCMPRYLKDVFWPELFYRHIDSKIKVVGCTINFDIMEHIQSYVFCVDKIGLDILINNKIFAKNLDKDKYRIITDHEIKILFYIKQAGYQGYTFETVRNYDNKKLIKNGNLSDGKYFKDNYYHDISPFEVIFVKQRLNHNNNALLFYLKSMDIELIKPEKPKPIEKVVEENINIYNSKPNNSIKNIIVPDQNNSNKNIIVPDQNDSNKNKITKSKIISVKNVIDENRRIKIFNAFK